MSDVAHHAGVSQRTVSNVVNNYVHVSPATRARVQQASTRSRAKALIDAGEIGGPVFATWRFGGEANHGNSPHANLIETQCHGFDMLEHLVGGISTLSAHMSDKTYGAFSTIALALEFENRAVGTMLGSYDSSYAYPDSQRVEINGTEGRLVIRSAPSRSRAVETTSNAAGTPATSTTRRAPSPAPSTATSTRSSMPSAPAPSRQCPPRPAAAPSNLPWPRSNPTRPAVASA